MEIKSYLADRMRQIASEEEDKAEQIDSQEFDAAYVQLKRSPHGYTDLADDFIKKHWCVKGVRNINHTRATYLRAVRELDRWQNEKDALVSINDVVLNLFWPEGAP